jgi:D-galactarolactone cycloisomerase
MGHRELAKHHVRKIEAFEVTSRYPRLVSKNARRGTHGVGPTTRVSVVTTDRGGVGWGVSRIDDQEAERFVGKSLAELFDPALGVIAPEAAGLDLALHDLAGVILDKPVYEMLGGHGDIAVACYDGAIYMDDLLPEDEPRGVDAILKNCESDYHLGYRAFKLKIGRGYKWMDREEGLQRDIEVTRRVRDRFPGCGILADANDGYGCDDLLRYLDAVADCELFWIEEPFPENRRDLVRLREFLAKDGHKTLVADGESRPDVPFLLKLASEGLIDVLIMDILGLGFTAWRQLMPRVADAKAWAAPHTWGDRLKTHYAAELAAGLGNVLTVEGVPAETADVDWRGYRLEAGSLRVPERPGFGMRLIAATRSSAK